MFIPEGNFIPAIPAVVTLPPSCYYLYTAGANLFVCIYVLHSDITALAKDKAYARISLDETSIHQVTAKC